MRLLIILLLTSYTFGEQYFPGDVWETKTIEESGLTQDKVDTLFDLTFNDEATMGAILIKDGYIVREQYAEGFNQNSHGTSWSTAKSFYAALIGISLDRGEIESLDDPVSKYISEYDNPEKKTSQ